nr:hypothetical protein BaRGS_033658 [Batillaria attramentaria]
MEHHTSLSLHLLPLTLALTLALAPLAQAQDVTYSVSEEQQAKSFVGNVARDINLEALLPTQVFNSVQYSILASSGPHGDLFQIDSETADLFTARRLDRETTCRFSVVCELDIKVGAVAGQYFKNIRVRVHLRDVNDNAPRFNRSSMNLEIPESVTVGASYTLPGALDDDSGVNNSVQSYALSPDDGPFSIFFTQRLDGTSDVTLVVNEQLDREKKDSYSLRLIASDGGVPRRTAEMSVSVQVTDINDNAPRFSQASYQRSIGENVRPGDSILKVTATDDDEGLNAEVRYRLSARQEGSMAALFSVDEVTGDILIQQLPTSGQYSIIVEAVDGGSPPKETQVEVNVNIIDTTNNPPQIVVTLLSQAISEGSTLRSPVAHVSVEDPDSGNNGQVNCFSQSAYFDLRRLEGDDMMVEVARGLDREDTPSYRVTLFCQDSGTPRLNATATFMVETEDVNDNPPVFPNPNISVTFPEGDRVGQVLLTVIATDADIGVNAEISYSILGGDGYFYIPKGTGSIAAARPLDRETRDEYVMKVLAVDGGEPQQSATATITITVEDINDEVPVFTESEYIFRMRENKPAGTLVGVFQATDPDLGDGGRVTFSLSASQPHASSMFVLHPNGTLLTKGMLDRESSSEIIFHVIASDQGDPKLTSIQEVTLILWDENDNRPVFLFPGPSNHSLTLYVPIKEGAHLFKLSVMDADEGQNSVLTYGLASSNASTMFTVDSWSGDVWAKESIREGHLGVYGLDFQATDGGDPPLSSSSILSLTVKLNPDSQPIATETNNAVIVISIVCATVVVAVIIVLIVCWVRRRDKGKELQYVNKMDKNNDKAKASSAPDPYLERQNTPSMFFTSSSNGHANGSLSPKLSIGFPSEVS